MSAESPPSPDTIDVARLVRGLIRNVSLLVHKGTPIYKDGKTIGYKVPVRVFEKLRSKSHLLKLSGGYNEPHARP